MIYFRDKIRILRQEYRKKDRKKIIAAAGNKCSMCDRKPGDTFVFGPTKYLKRRLKFKVRMDIHVVEGATLGRGPIVICDGCHLSYHLFNRLSEDAELGCHKKTGRSMKLSDTLYNRCPKCKELSCMCCDKCGKQAKWCTCGKVKTKAKTKRRKTVGAKTMKVRVKSAGSCKKHPRYKAMRKPTSGCRTCMKLYKDKKR